MKAATWILEELLQVNLIGVQIAQEDRVVLHGRCLVHRFGYRRLTAGHFAGIEGRKTSR